MRQIILLMAAIVLAAGCSSSVGFGDDKDGVGIRSTVAKDGKIFSIETADGEGNIK